MCHWPGSGCSGPCWPLAAHPPSAEGTPLNRHPHPYRSVTSHATEASRPVPINTDFSHLIHLYTCDDTHQRHPGWGESLPSPAVPGQRLAWRWPRTLQVSQTQVVPSTPGRHYYRRVAVVASRQPKHCPFFQRGGIQGHGQTVCPFNLSHSSWLL